jgi:hypothetical protein
MPKKILTPDDPGFYDEKFDEELFMLEELLQEEMYEKSERSLYQFFINFWNTFDPQPLVNNWHIECLCEHIQAALNRNIRRLIINIPPRSSKSTTASITAPVWWWINHPQEKFWLASHSERLFMQNIIYGRRILEHPLYKDRWCDPKNEDYFRYSLATDSNTKKRIDNDMNGYILGCSPTSKVLGTGYTVAILDDILDSEESNNPNMIKGVNDWFTQTFLNRSNDVNNDVIILVMQRLAENDITGYIMETYGDQGWFLLSLPAKYIPEKTFVSPIKFNDIRKVRNELLDPHRLPDSFLSAQAKNPIIYNTRYQQDPTATGDGNLIKEEWLIETDARPINYSTMMTVWDLSFNESPTSSYTVGLVLCKMDDKYYIVDMYRNKCSIPEQLDAIRKLKKKYPKSRIGIEAKANGHAAMSLLEREINNIYAFDPRKFGGSKEQRLGSILTYFRDKKIVIYNPFQTDLKLETTYDPAAIKAELKSFPIGSHDDIVDCIAYGVQYLAEFGNESVGFITKGAKIKIAEDDWTKARFKEMGINTNTIDKLDHNSIEIFSDFPHADDLRTLEW